MKNTSYENINTQSNQGLKMTEYQQPKHQSQINGNRLYPQNQYRMQSNYQSANSFNQYGTQPQYSRPIEIPTTQIVTFNNGPGFCKICKRVTASNSIYENGTGSWVICLVILAFGLMLGCCLIPFCVQDCKDQLTYCSNCGGLKSQKCLI